MTLDEAVKIVESPKFGTTWPTPLKEKEAMKLIIGAGKFVQRNRGQGAGHVPQLLPGETID